MKRNRNKRLRKWTLLIPFLVMSLVMAFMTVTVFAEPDEGDPFENVQFFELEQLNDGPRKVFDDGSLKFKLTDAQALNVDGVTHYGGFVGIPGDKYWEELAGCYTYDDSNKIITVDGVAIGNRYPDPETAPGNIAVQIVGYGEEDEVLMIAGFMDVEFWYAYEEFDLEEERDVLPHWDGDFQKTINVYVENSEYPEGEDLEATITNVEVTEGRELLEEFKEDSDGENSWWYYRAGEEFGDVKFSVSYENYDGELGTHEMNLHIKEHVYEVHMDSEDDLGVGLPGTGINLEA